MNEININNDFLEGKTKKESPWKKFVLISVGILIIVGVIWYFSSTTISKSIPTNHNTNPIVNNNIPADLNNNQTQPYQDNRPATNVPVSPPDTKNPIDLLASCLSSRAILFINSGCPACVNQENIFHDSVKYLNIVDCKITPQKCVGIKNIPAWQINDKLYPGIFPLIKLKQMSGC